jgi:uncharacterized membrane protein YkvA (DUF1232 family)
MHDPRDPDEQAAETEVEILESVHGGELIPTRPASSSDSSGPLVPLPRRAGALRIFFSCIPGIPSLVALYTYLMDDDAPSGHQLAILLSFLYFIWPLDLIKDFFLGPGYIDDLAVFIGLLKFIGSENLRPYRTAARKWLRGEIEDPGQLEKPGNH